MKNPIIYETEGSIMSFTKQGWKHVAFIDNEAALVDLVKCNSWHDNNGYLYCTKLNKYLHRLVMEFYIGKEQLEKLTDNDFVVDHINNSEPYNCCLDNLHLIPSNINKAKGLTVDKDIERVRLIAGIGLYCLKDRSYQIALGFNTNVFLKENDKWIQLDRLYVSFDNFDKFYNALQIVISFLNGKCNLNINELQTKTIKYTETEYLELTESEKNIDGPFIIRGNKVFMKINNTPETTMRIIHKPAKKEE